MFETAGDLRPKAIWPTGWIETEYVYPAPPLVITQESGRFVVWEERNLHYSIRSFHYRMRWWHCGRPDRLTALRQALDWVHSYSGRQTDLAPVREVVDEYEERDKQLAAIDDLLSQE